MASREIVITIRLQIDSDEDVHVEVATDPSSLGEHETQENRPADQLDQFIDDNAPRSLAKHQHDFARRCAHELGCSPELPASARTYVNVFPPKRYGSRRAAAFETRSGRVEIYCPPDLAEGSPFASAVLNNGEPTDAVKLYLKSEAEVDEAIRLTKIGLEARR
jgi:hypothetical protein